jgi:phosphomannomutase
VKRENMDGIKAYLGNIGWVMVRGSGTEPMLRIYSETTSAVATKHVLDEVSALVHRL